VGDSFDQAPPGHRFRVYFAGWDDRWGLDKNQKDKALSTAVVSPRRAAEEIGAVRARQQDLAAGAPSMALLEGESTAPFATGLGIEHPLENGFAFLDPYGLPYLPGSSVKGVVRRAGEELALFETDNHGWSIPALWWLFGFDANSGFFAPEGNDAKPIREERSRWREAFRRHLEGLGEADQRLLEAYAHLAFPRRGGGSSPPAVERACSWIPHGGKAGREIREIHTRGALEFWDVLPEPKDGKLRVDIMNPHYNHYYQGNEPPGDWGNPIPIFFLTLPAGTGFTFIARFRPAKEWPAPVRQHFEAQVDAAPRWRAMLDAAFAFAFDWLGFGAKTAVGYGRMAGKGPAPHDENCVSGTSSAPAAVRHHEVRPPIGSPPGAPSSAGSNSHAHSGPPPLAKIERRIAAISSARDLSTEAQELANELVKNRANPDAARLAGALWSAIQRNQWLKKKLSGNPEFEKLVKKGGAE
jgi:CRISPR-associated protein Cmr6